MAAKHSSKAQQLSPITAAFLEHGSFLRKFLGRYLGERQDIEDVIQQTYLRAWKIEQRRAIDHPKAFLFQIAKNLALTELTRKSRQITEYLAGFDDSRAIENESVTLEQEIEASEHLGLYCEAVAALPKQCRRVYLLRKIHGLSHREIAERMGITVSSVEKHLLNGVLRCRAYVRQREDIPQAEPGAGKTSARSRGKGGRS